MQLLQARLAELPVTQLADCIKAEMDDNPALEAMQPDEPLQYQDENYDDTPTDEPDDDYEATTEREERRQQLDEALSSIGQDDEELPIYGSRGYADETAYEPGETFYDSLTMQMMETELTPRQREIMEYIIGSLDDDGWLRKSVGAIADKLRDEMMRLNPKPGASLGDYGGDTIHQITPDVYIDTHDDGSISFALNNTDIPDLAITPSFIDMVRQDQGNADKMSRQMREALMYARNKVDLAQRFIDAVRMRRSTLTMVVKAIIHWQRAYLEDGDDTSLRPMKLKDIAEKTGMDISTVSRVCNGKYAQTRWGILPLRHFFSDGYVTDDGEETSTKSIKAAMEELISNEDKSKPLSDEAIAQMMAEKGYPIARRTVAKYREKLGIPVARMRR